MCLPGEGIPQHRPRYARLSAVDTLYHEGDPLLPMRLFTSNPHFKNAKAILPLKTIASTIEEYVERLGQSMPSSFTTNNTWDWTMRRLDNALEALATYSDAQGGIAHLRRHYEMTKKSMLASVADEEPLQPLWD
ncbi:unnamed protein product [Sympodiomycopsis kandeliae]